MQAPFGVLAAWALVIRDCKDLAWALTWEWALFIRAAKTSTWALTREWALAQDTTVGAHSLLSACFLLSARFLADKRMRLTTSVYGNSSKT